MLTSLPKGRIIVVYLGDKDMMYSASEYNVPEDFRFAKAELDKSSSDYEITWWL